MVILVLMVSDDCQFYMDKANELFLACAGHRVIDIDEQETCPNLTRMRDRLDYRDQTLKISITSARLLSTISSCRRLEPFTPLRSRHQAKSYAFVLSMVNGRFIFMI